MRQTKGFTLIELMLAMSFVSVLLVAIAMLTIQISNIYTRGITLKEVNESGLEISNDMQRSIQSGEVFDVPDNGVSSDNYVALEKVDGKALAGRLCLGSNSYVWNYGELLGDESILSTLTNRYDDQNSSTPIRFVKVYDADKKLCKKDENGNYPVIVKNDAVTELLATGDRDLALHKLTLSSNEEGGLYAVSITIGTNDQALLSDNRDQCKPPSEIVNQSEYCSVNTFDIVARAGSKDGSNE